MINLFELLAVLPWSSIGKNDLRSEPLTNFADTSAAARASSKADQVSGNLRILEANLAKSMLINEALWEIISEKLNLSEADLLKKIQEVDLRDGKLDGKNQRKAVKCPSCHHTVSARHPACLYCGKVIDNSIFTIN